MAGASVRFEDKQIKLFLLNIEKKSPRSLIRAVDRTTVFGTRKLKSTLPRRTGLLRKSYLPKKTGKFSRDIDSPLPYAIPIEFGGKPRVKPITPNAPKKFLTIPIKESVLTGSKAQIKKSALDRLFSRLGKAKKKDRFNVMKSVGIILSKKAKPKKIKAQRNIKREVQPATDGRFLREVELVFRRLGFR